MKSIWNRFTEWLNDKLNVSFEGFSLPNGGTIAAFDLQLGKIPTFSTGGFPEDGLFIANHSELAGKFADGRTAVANNEQIISGIANGVREANAEEIALLREQNNLLQGILEKETGITYDEVGKAAKKYAQRYYKRTGRPAYT